MQANIIGQTFLLLLPFIGFAATFAHLKADWQLISIALGILLSLLTHLNKTFFTRILSHIVLSTLILLTTIEVIFFIAIHLNPPITPDGHSVMPIAHLFLSILFGSILAALLIYICFRKTKIALGTEKYFFFFLTSVISIIYLTDYII